MATSIEPLNDDTLAHATSVLARRDAALKAIVTAHGIPPMWPIEPGFGGLINIILGQQVSVASARAAWTRLIQAIGPPAPNRLLELNDDAMLAIGFSRQKAGYARDLARMIQSGGFDPSSLAWKSDDEVRKALMAIRGIGRWSADIYLLMALRRPDIWPSGDLALITATREMMGLGDDADRTEVERVADTWRPWRSVAARILWVAYLRAKERGVGRDMEAYPARANVERRISSRAGGTSRPGKNPPPGSPGSSPVRE